MYKAVNLIEKRDNGELEKIQATKRIRYKGKNCDFPVYRINLEYLYYNDKNGRITTDISEYKEKNGNIEEIDIDERNKIIEKFIVDSNPQAMKKTKSNIEAISQQKAGVVLADGRIIDGNRRFTCLRQLFRETNNSKFGYFEAIILEGLNDKEIKSLELELQQGEDKPVDYNAIEKLVEIYLYVINGEFSPKEYATKTNKTISEVNLMIDKANLMIDFLDYLDKPEKFYIAKEMELDGPLQEIRNIQKRLKDDDEKWAKVRVLLFDSLKLKPNGDMVRYIRDLGNNIIFSGKFDEYFNKQMEIMEDTTETYIPEDENNSIEINEDNNESNCEIKKDKEDSQLINIEKQKDMENIRQYRKQNEQAQMKLEQLFNNYNEDAKYINSRRKPIDQTHEVYNKIDLIDTYAISKMNLEEKNEIRNCIEKIKNKIKEIENIL